jgi:4-hydroxy-tetrahydrodipicolinate synthase
MITPFDDSAGIDWKALESLVDWYVAKGATGLFAVCQSSEMFFLSLRERVELARACVRLAGGRVPVIASGHTAESMYDQIDEVKAMADTGVAAVVLITNRFARRGEGEDVFKKNLERLLAAVSDDVLLGFYECPYPYKRVLTPELMRFAVSTGRFGFLKDTSCSMESIRGKIEATADTGFKLFNANAATLLQSLRAGASGYSGVMANFHPELYVRLCRTWRQNPAEAEELQDFLGFASVMENQLYPVNAMHWLALEGLPIHLNSRRSDSRAFSESMRLEVEQFRRTSLAFSARAGVAS